MHFFHLCIVRKGGKACKGLQGWLGALFFARLTEGGSSIDSAAVSIFVVLLVPNMKVFQKEWLFQSYIMNKLSYLPLLMVFI